MVFSAPRTASSLGCSYGTGCTVGADCLSRSAGVTSCSHSFCLNAVTVKGSPRQSLLYTALAFKMERSRISINMVIETRFSRCLVGQADRNWSILSTEFRNALYAPTMAGTWNDERCITSVPYRSIVESCTLHSQLWLLLHWLHPWQAVMELQLDHCCKR